MKLAWPAALAATVVLPFATVLAGRHTLAHRDTAQVHLPLRGLVSEALRDGRLPLWNPHEGAGKPLLADAIHGVLHPWSILSAFADPGGVDLLLVLYLVTAALGAWALARELGLSPPAAFAAGAAYGLSGYVVSMTSALVFLAGASALPWQVAALAACGRRARFGLPLAAVATALGLFTGDGQVVIVGALLGAALAAERGGWRTLGTVAAGTALGALVAAVQVVPSAVLAAGSTRAAGITGMEGRVWALSPWRLAELAAPGLFYRLQAGASDATAAAFEWLDTGGQYLPFGASVYVGAPVLALAAAAPFRERRARLLLVAALVLLWLALGHHAGARALVGRVPVWRSFRYAEKLVVPLSLSLALLAAHGLAAVGSVTHGVAGGGLAGPGGAAPSRRRVAIALGLLAAMPAVALAVAQALPDAVAPARPDFDPVGALRANLAAGLPVALAGAALAGLALLAPRPPLRAGLLAAAVAASLLLGLPFARHLGDPAAIVGGVAANLDAPPPGVRFTVPELSLPRSAGFDDPDGRTRAQSLLGVAAWNVRDRVDALDTYGPFDPQRWLLVAGPLAEGRPVLFRHFAGTHVVLQAPARPGRGSLRDDYARGGRLVFRDPALPAFVYEVPHRPWALFASAASLAPGPGAALARLQEDLRDLRDEAVVEAAALPSTGPGTVLAVRRRAGDVALDVEAAADGLLVVNDAFWPGWQARVDGHPAPIFPTDVLVRSVPVPAGLHRVTMAYDPPEVAWGLAASALGFALLAASVGVLARRAARADRSGSHAGA